MGVGRATAPQNFPPLFGPYHRTELLAALFLHGPMRAPLLKRVFSLETARSVKRPKSNVANLLVSVYASKGRPGGSGLVGVNPNLPVRAEVRRLLQAMAAHYTVRKITNDALAVELKAFRSAKQPPVEIEALFGTYIRTRLLVALYALDGQESIGKLQRAVLEHFAGRVRVAIKAYVEEGVLTQDGTTIRFNQSLPWLPELHSLLGALAGRMPEVVSYARYMREVRDEGEAGTGHAHGQRFRLFGSRVNQAILAFLAAYGPSNIMDICAAAGAVSTSAIDPLVRSGVVTRMHSRKGRKRDLFSLNADHPVYRELKALLRTEALLDDALPFRRRRDYFDGSDLSAPKRQYLPYQIFGVPGKAARADILALLYHTPNKESDAASLSGILGDHGYSAIMKALQGLEEYGVLTSRVMKSRVILYRLNPNWGGLREMQRLLSAMGRAWPEFKDGKVEADIHQGNSWRAALERGRKPA